MKSKLRNINVNGLEFKYSISEKYERTKWSTKLRIFRSGYKNYPLEIHFESRDDYYLGNLLLTSVEKYNLHKPGNIRLIIEEGLRQGWDGEIKGIVIEEGMDILEGLGFEIDDLKVT
ncbi:MAG: hypothetical protein NXI20_27680 [bacterium]|nr:hypothetical protein [bacterium]